MGKPTEELRRLLDARGVSYEGHGAMYATWYDSPKLGEIQVLEDTLDGNLFMDLFGLTPGQVIDITLGRTARAVMTSDGVCGHCECGACGKSIDPWDAYCRHCGVRVG